MKIKNTIAGKLTAYFAISLLLFSLIISCMFALLFARQTTTIHKSELENKAVAMADTLSGYMESGGGHGGGGHGGYGAFIRFLDEIAMTDVWVMDSESNLITFSHGHDSISYSDIPADAGDVIQQALKGNVAFGEGFSDLLGVSSITAAAPIRSSSGAIAGVVLLHTPLQGIGTAISDGLSLMGASIITALLLATAAAVLLALHFTKPLHMMKNTALRLADGDYQAKTHITQKDEIGELAATIDLLASRLSDSADAAEELTRMRQDFIANISHELRTPVTVIRGSLEALRDGVVTQPDMIAQYHQQMLFDSIHLERLVNDLLELTRLQNPGFRIEKSPVSLCDILHDTARSMERMAHQKQLTIKTICCDDPCTILGDYGRIRQMLVIAVDNAIKFSFENREILLRLTRENDIYRLSVHNFGETIPPGDLPHVFDRFHRSRDESNKKGTGLGLAIASQIAFRHNIKIELQSKNQETIITFCCQGHSTCK